MFGREDLIDTSRLRQCVESHVPVYVWTDDNVLRRLTFTDNAKAMTLKPFALGSVPQFSSQSVSGESVGHADMKFESGRITLANVQSDDGLALSGFRLTPWQYDFLQFDATIKDGAAVPDMRVVWAGPQAHVDRSLVARNYMSGTVTQISATPDGSARHYKVTVPLSHSWHWFAEPVVGNILILPGGAQQVEFRNIQLVSAAAVAPLVSVVGRSVNNAGIIETSAKELALSLSRPPTGAIEYQIQIGKPNFFLDNFNQADVGTAIGSELFCAVHVHPDAGQSPALHKHKALGTQPRLHRQQALRGRTRSRVSNSTRHFRVPVTTRFAHVVVPLGTSRLGSTQI